MYMSDFDAFRELVYFSMIVRRRIFVILGVMSITMFISFFFMGTLINKIKNDLAPPGVKVIYLSPLEVIWLELKMSFIIGLLAALPIVFFYLYKELSRRNEEIKKIFTKKVVLSYGILSIIMFLVGAIYNYKIMLPLLLQYLLSSAQTAGVIAQYSIYEFVYFVILTTVIYGFVFEMPIIMTFILRRGLTRLETLKYYRRHAYVGILIIAAIITGPDVFSQIIVAGPMIVFYEISLFISKFTLPRRNKFSYREK